MKHGLPETTIDHICTVLRHYPQVDQAILYGSRAKGNYKTGSDIDITLQGNAGLTLNVVFRILDDIEELLLPYTIDLSILHHISDPQLLDHIRRVGVTFYNRNEEPHKITA